MAKWERARSLMPGEHLPPVDRCTILRAASKSKIKPIELIEVPLDDFGVPKPVELIHAVASTVDADYDWPRVSNIHHLAWPKRSYYEDSSKSAIAYRESTALLVDMPIQLHNLIHLVTPPPIKPNPEVMGQRVIEQEQAGTLFELGRLAIRYARWMQEVEAMRDNVTLARSRDLLEASSYYESLSRNFDDRYRRYLDQIEDGWVGLLPSRESLHQMGLIKATKQLGKIAAVRSIDLRRESQVAVEHLGIR